jgi:hypothetical protein
MAKPAALQMSLLHLLIMGHGLVETTLDFLLHGVRRHFTEMKDIQIYETAPHFIGIPIPQTYTKAQRSIETTWQDPRNKIVCRNRRYTNLNFPV